MKNVCMIKGTAINRICNGLARAGYDVIILLDQLADPENCIYPLDSKIRIEKSATLHYGMNMIRIDSFL